MAIDTLVFKDDITPLDLLLFRRFRQEVPGLVEQTLDRNYGLATKGVLPVHGTGVVVTTPSPINAPTARKVVRLYD